MIKIKPKRSNDVAIRDVKVGRAYRVLLGDNNNGIGIGDTILALYNCRTMNIEILHQDFSVCDISELKQSILLQDLGEFINIEVTLTR